MDQTRALRIPMKSYHSFLHIYPKAYLKGLNENALKRDEIYKQIS